MFRNGDTRLKWMVGTTSKYLRSLNAKTAMKQERERKNIFQSIFSRDSRELMTTRGYLGPSFYSPGH